MAKVISMVDELTYASYRFNRRNSPDVSPERWARIYSNVEGMEERFQAEVIKVGVDFIMSDFGEDA